MEAKKNRKVNMRHRFSSGKIFLLMGLFVFLVLLNTVVGFSIVVGSSCEPTLRSGELVVVVRRIMPVNRGDLVIFSDPDNYRVVKRIVEIDGDKMWVLGDNPDNSVDSRVYGYVELSKIEGRVFRLPFSVRFVTGSDSAYALQKETN